MANNVHLRKNDAVIVLTGKDRGKQGKILNVIPGKSRVLVEGINIAVKHKKQRSAADVAGIIHKEMPIHSSNVMLICENCKSPTKIEKKVLENGEKVRICKKCGEQIGVIKKEDNE